MHSIRSLLLGTTACALLATGGIALAQTAPATSSSASVAADNSGINERDRSTGAMTPTDQPNDKADIKLAAAVRRAIVKDKSLSISAHNVKLVAANGVVTLRGPVKNAEEKTKIEADAKGVAGVKTVNNELDVKN